MKLPSVHSLFVRLLVGQILLALGLTAVLATVFYAERNRTVAQLVAARWAPALREAAGMAAAGGGTVRPGTVLHSADRPKDVLPALSVTPRLAALTEALRADQIEVREFAVSRTRAANGEPVLWMSIAAPGAAPQWLGFASELIEPRLRERLVLALVLVVLLVVMLSAWITRRLTRPLEQLRERMDAYDVGAVPGSGGASRERPLPGASAEVAAIDGAWRQLCARIESQERERALLLAGVSHDLRSPLARIRLAAEMLPEEGALAPRRESIVRNVQVADRLIGSFLDHVRAAEQPLTERADLAALARAAVARHPPGQQAADLQAPQALWLDGVDSLLLERLLANLLDNAYTHGRPPVRLRLSARGSGAVVEVIDAGPGIPHGQRPLALQAFSRGDPGRGLPGTGLGLAIVARIASRLGGGVSFYDEPDGFVVRVVLTPAASALDSTARDSAWQDRRR